MKVCFGLRNKKNFEDVPDTWREEYSIQKKIKKKLEERFSSSWWMRAALLKISERKKKVK